MWRCIIYISTLCWILKLGLWLCVSSTLAYACAVPGTLSFILTKMLFPKHELAHKTFQLQINKGAAIVL